MIEETQGQNINSDCSILCFYVNKGEVDINKNTKLKQGDVLVISDFQNELIEVQAIIKTELIVVSIKEG